MNKRFSVIAVILVGVICFTGCIENAALMKLNKDGSGTLTYRIFMSNEAMQMVQGLSSGMAGEGDGAGVDLSSLDPIESMKQGLEDKFGDAATLESSKEISNKQGWKGIEAIYEFDDVNKLNLVDMGKGMDSGDSSGGMGNMGTPYRFEFVGGDVATLKIIPITTDKEAAEAAVEAAAEELPEELTGMGMDGMEDMQLAMMKPMMAGMRITLLVAVDGDIVDTNSRFRSEKHPNVVTLMDIGMDKLFEHPKAMGIMGAGDDGAEKLAALDIPGVKIEDPKKEVTISFK